MCVCGGGEYFLLKFVFLSSIIVTFLQHNRYPGAIVKHKLSSNINQKLTLICKAEADLYYYNISSYPAALPSSSRRVC